MSLSDKIVLSVSYNGEILHAKDVKDFIQKLKDDIKMGMLDVDGDNHLADHWDIHEVIDKLAGDALTGKPVNLAIFSGTQGCGKIFYVGRFQHFCQKAYLCPNCVSGDRKSVPRQGSGTGSGNARLKFNCTCPVGECVCKNNCMKCPKDSILVGRGAGKSK